MKAVGSLTQASSLLFVDLFETKKINKLHQKWTNLGKLSLSSCSSTDVLTDKHLGPFLLTLFNFNPSMDKYIQY